MDLKGRLIEFIEYKGLSVQSFELQCSLSNGAVSKWVIIQEEVQ